MGLDIIRVLTDATYLNDVNNTISNVSNNTTPYVREIINNSIEHQSELSDIAPAFGIIILLGVSYMVLRRENKG